ncbi:phosphatase PAP2 family protein, partial [Streptomyces parvulus]|uniref:phosphatase PAP2 family protein n=1 Tax=Streptomyces parvulus TaxID=146923 RepID=UPI0033BA6102
WLAAGLAGAAVDRGRRGAWLRGTALTAGAHLGSMAVKRVVRRPRPAHVVPLVRTAGRHSFPSSHATSAAAAAVAFGALGVPAVRPLAAAVCASRLVAGVHYPSDVAAGAALGALTARLGAGWMRGGARD